MVIDITSNNQEIVSNLIDIDRTIEDGANKTIINILDNAVIEVNEKSEQITEHKRLEEERIEREKQERERKRLEEESKKPKFNDKGLLIMKSSNKAQVVINKLLFIPNHRNGSSYHKSIDPLIDELSTEEAIWVLWRIEGKGFGQTGDGYAGIDSHQSHRALVNNQINRRFNGSIHNLLKKWGTYNYGGY